jgi:hypothetical protein
VGLLMSDQGVVRDMSDRSIGGLISRMRHIHDIDVHTHDTWHTARFSTHLDIRQHDGRRRLYCSIPGRTRDKGTGASFDHTSHTTLPRLRSAPCAQPPAIPSLPPHLPPLTSPPLPPSPPPPLPPPALRSTRPH